MVHLTNTYPPDPKSLTWRSRGGSAAEGIPEEVGFAVILLVIVLGVYIAVKVRKSLGSDPPDGTENQSEGGVFGEIRPSPVDEDNQLVSHTEDEHEVQKHPD